VNKKGRGRPKITLVEVVKRGMTIKGVTKSMTLVINIKLVVDYLSMSWMLLVCVNSLLEGPVIDLISASCLNF